jgi:hypothetical protein
MMKMRLPALDIFDGIPVVKLSEDVNLSAPLHTGMSEVSRLQHVVHLLFPPTVRLQDITILSGHVHHLRLLNLSNGVQLVLKSSPSSTISLLHQERMSLETEARALALLGQSANPCIPQLFHYAPQGGSLGAAFLLRQYVKGTSLLEMEPMLTSENRKDIDRHLGFLVNVIGQQVSASFGSLAKVASGGGNGSWRQTFISLFEEVLRDAEDMYIHLPYGNLREQIHRLALALDGITLPRLVIVNFGRPSEVILDPELKQLAGIVDFGSAFWGDVMMAEIFECPSDALFDGFGSFPSKEPFQAARLLL